MTVLCLHLGIFLCKANQCQCSHPDTWKTAPGPVSHNGCYIRVLVSDQDRFHCKQCLLKCSFHYKANQSTEIKNLTARCFATNTFIVNYGNVVHLPGLELGPAKVEACLCFLFTQNFVMCISISSIYLVLCIFKLINSKKRPAIPLTVSHYLDSCPFS